MTNKSLFDEATLNRNALILFQSIFFDLVAFNIFTLFVKAWFICFNLYEQLSYGAWLPSQLIENFIHLMQNFCVFDFCGYTVKVKSDSCHPRRQQGFSSFCTFQLAYQILACIC